jgi:hypothetical protein
MTEAGSRPMTQSAFGRNPSAARRRPDVLNDDAKRLAESFVLPDESLAEVAAPYCRPARETAPTVEIRWAISLNSSLSPT